MLDPRKDGTCPWNARSMNPLTEVCNQLFEGLENLQESCVLDPILA